MITYLISSPAYPATTPTFITVLAVVTVFECSTIPLPCTFSKGRNCLAVVVEIMWKGKES